MVREYLVKSFMFPEISGNSIMPLSYTTFPIVGEILRIKCAQNATGSLRLFESGTNLALSIYNATLTSGTSSIYNVYPRVYTTMVNGVTGSPQLGDLQISNTVLAIGVSGIASGTAVKIGPFEVYYR
jgi:hypothetical protein